MQSRLTASIFSLGIGVFFLTASFGVFFVGMNVQMDGEMSHCPFMMDAICTMTPLGHITAVQGVFQTLPRENDFVIFLVLIMAFVVAISSFQKLLGPPQLSRASLAFANVDYTPLRHSLQEAFSRGILNPKIY